MKYFLPIRNNRMKKKEKKVLSLLVKAYNKFIELPELHEDDQTEFRQGIHALQNIVMSREAVRAEPELFRNSKSPSTGSITEHHSRSI